MDDQRTNTMDLSITSPKGRLFWTTLLVIAGGFFFRLWYLSWSPYESPDTGVFLQLSRTMTHPFDTSPREPVFVWWMGLLDRWELSSFKPTQAITALL
jgi:hypothetical protein